MTISNNNNNRQLRINSRKKCISSNIFAFYLNVFVHSFQRLEKNPNYSTYESTNLTVCKHFN